MPTCVSFASLFSELTCLPTNTKPIEILKCHIRQNIVGQIMQGLSDIMYGLCSLQWSALSQHSDLCT